MAGRHPLTIECEQAIYGSFPFWDKGYALLAASEGCQKSWIDDFIRLCRSLGQPPGEASPEFDSLIFASPVASGRWVIALGSAQGCDDRGRPGAWAFHALFLSNADYRRAGASPFVFETYLNRKFQKDMSISNIDVELSSGKNRDMKLNRLIINTVILNRLKKFRKIRIIDENTSINHFREFWCHLPEKTRISRSTTTMSFRHNTDFDIAVIKPAAWPPDLSANQQEIITVTFPEIFATPEIANNKRIIYFKFPKWYLPKNFKRIGMLLTLLALCLIGFFTCNSPSTKKSVESSDFLSVKSNLPPDVSRFLALPEKLDLTHAVKEKLIDMAERLHLEMDSTMDSADEIAARVSAAIRYQGPLITLRIDPDRPGGRQAEMMDNAIRQFSEMKSWPKSEFSGSNARLALANLAWSAGEMELSEKAANLQSRIDVQEWFDEFSQKMIPADIEKMLLPTGLESEWPELVEYRLHLIRISEIAMKQ